MGQTYAFEPGECWHPAGEATMYRLIGSSATYDPCQAWPGVGRFDVDGIPTLYMSRSAEGAVAEYYRRHPEFLAFQGRLKHRLFRLGFTGEGDGLDVRSTDRAERVGVSYERLRSSDKRRDDRFRECHDLARAVVASSGRCIEYPSAAYDGAENVVALGSFGWHAAVEQQIALPPIEPALVRALPPGADP